MSKFDYELSKRVASGLELDGVPTFASLIMAAYRKADSDNASRLRLVFPEITRELDERYNAPGGMLPGESEVDYYG